MDADANYGDMKRVVFLSMYHQAVKPIVIENSVVDPFGCDGYRFFDRPLCRGGGNIRIQVDIPIQPCLGDPPIFGSGAGTFTFCGMFFTERAVPSSVTVGVPRGMAQHCKEGMTAAW